MPSETLSRAFHADGSKVGERTSGTLERLCGALGMAVIAEGIETKAELDYLMKQTSIRSGQGFLLERPFFIEDEPNIAQSRAA